MLLRNLLLGAGALTFLLGVGLLALWLNQGQNGQTSQTQAPQTQILVASHNISTGTLLRREDMSWKTIFAADLVPENLARGQASEADFTGSVARRDFRTGESLMRDALVHPGDRGFLAAVLTPGTRAVSIAVDAPQSSSGLLMPGDRVDIVLTQNFGDAAATAGRKSVGETVLRNLRVIAVDQALSPNSRSAPVQSGLAVTEPRVPRTVTLEVTERDAEALFVATQLGKIELSIRALDASGATPVTLAASRPTWASDVSAALTQFAPAAALPAGKPTASAPARSAIEVMHGSKTETR